MTQRMATEVQAKLAIGPRDGIQYPLSIQYCGNCSMPLEYCEYYPEYEKCKQWLEKNLPDEFLRIKLGTSDGVTGGPVKVAGSADGDDAAGGGGEEDKKRQKRGGKGMMKTKKAKDDVPKKICLSRSARGKKKSVTVVTGLATFDIDLKVAAKFFGTKFACGSSVTGDDEIVIQGDVKDDLFDIIPEKWPEIDEDFIEDLGDQKRS
ncbi:density-regulated protein homolog isoform X3 [Toxorhynchites rutilus septentrionalis]|uniref:density-regulated protein homolog isoform X3 n=1 Tax=Toxorhynchites rutilus septentrionalis TaxID=329112 RepID=UPI00247AECF1|nr:density-regulated protein homolog isoform X3 [Toxorhynchites rutilus septentrionalis]